MPPLIQLSTINPTPKKKKKNRGFHDPVIEKMVLDFYKTIKFTYVNKNDISQCIAAIGETKCYETICYLCGAVVLIRSKLAASCNKSYPNLYKNISYVSSADAYCQCEHVIPCETKIHEMNPYYRMIMITGITYKLIIKRNLIGEIQTNKRLNELLYTYNKAPTKDKNTIYNLDIMLRINYQWAHAICNGFKSNKNFIKPDISSDTFIIDIAKVKEYFDELFTPSKWNKVKQSIDDNFNLTDVEKGYETNITNQRKKASEILIEKLNVVIRVLNDPIYKTIRTPKKKKRRSYSISKKYKT